MQTRDLCDCIVGLGHQTVYPRCAELPHRPGVRGHLSDLGNVRTY